jgi:hypothetical protein
LRRSPWPATTKHPSTAPLDACAWLQNDHVDVIGDDAAATSVAESLSL